MTRIRLEVYKVGSKPKSKVFVKNLEKINADDELAYVGQPALVGAYA